MLEYMRKACDRLFTYWLSRALDGKACDFNPLFHKEDLQGSNQQVL
jgi:hypothetical protein